MALLLRLASLFFEARRNSVPNRVAVVKKAHGNDKEPIASRKQAVDKEWTFLSYSPSRSKVTSIT